MSVRATSEVWETADAKGSELLLLLALADYAHDDGTNAFPAVPTLAAKMRMTDRSVQRLLRKMEDAGQIEQAGTHPSGTTIYRLRCGSYAGGGGEKLSPGGGDAHVTGGVTPVSPKPSCNHQEEEEARVREDDGGLGLDSLPPGVRRYEDQILDVARRPPAARRARAYRALRAGNAPAAEVPNLLNAAAAEHGALAVCAALVVTDNDAEARYCPQRLAFFEAVLGDIAAHRRRSAMPAKAAPPKGRRAAPPVDGDLTPEDVAWHVAHSGLSAADFYKAGTDRRTGDPIHRLRPEARARVTS